MGTNSNIPSGNFFQFLLRICLRCQKIIFLLHSINTCLMHLPTTRCTQSIQIIQPPLSLTPILPPIRYHVLISVNPRSVNRSEVVYSTTNKILRILRGTVEMKTTGASPKRTGMPPFQWRNVILCKSLTMSLLKIMIPTPAISPNQLMDISSRSQI